MTSRMRRNIMSLYEKLIAKEAVLAVVGLGYVGMPIAVAFAKKGLNVIGFDTNSKKIEAYCSGADPTKEVSGTMARLKRLLLVISILTTMRLVKNEIFSNKVNGY